MSTQTNTKNYQLIIITIIFAIFLYTNNELVKSKFPIQGKTS